MYSQLRTQYPTASLTADLLVAEPSHYVVQAVIKIGESALATGLSAASTVEVAEDQARARALMILGISVHDYAPEVQVLNPTQAPPGKPAQLNPAAQPPMGTTARTENWEEEWNWHPDDEPLGHDPEALEIPMEECLAPIPQGLEDLPRPTDHARSRRKSPEKSPSKSMANPRTKPKVSAPPEPIDLSDIIAQTDIELRRLGWTHAEGRHFLEETYGKRSRQQLTDSELLEFLDYLKVQSELQDQPF